MADGSPSTSGPVTKTCPLSFTISDSHHETLNCHVTSLQTHAVILGIDWLHTHNPHIHWRKHLVSLRDEHCIKRCLSHYVPDLSLANLDLDFDSNDLESSDLSVDDLYSLQLASLFCRELSVIHEHSDPSLSLNSAEEKPVATLPPEYADFADLFKNRPLGTLPPHRPFDHTITLEPDAAAPFGPLYNLSEKELEALREFLDDNLKKGFIRHSESPAGAPVLFVPKKNNELRLCVDYRALNKLTVKNRCPLPLIAETLERLRNAKIFTKLDLKGAYNLIRIAKGEEWKTAIRTRYGHFEFLVMPFGLCNAPATFQAFLNDVLRECLDTVVVIYLDDILIYSQDKATHTADVRRVLQLLSDAQLQVNLEKCEFGVEKVEFLGYIISPEGVSMDPAKVAVITSWAVPTCVRDIQVFLGFANFYRRFIKNFSKLVGPMTRFLKKDVLFKWDTAAQSAFDALKLAFTSEPMLVHFDPSRPCTLEPDASKFALGNVCSQPDDNGVLHPVAFYSRSLTPPERNYHIHDTELLAVIEGLEHWRHYFAYSEYPALVLTDHKNLEYFSEKRALSERQIRYAERLSKFKVVLAYRPGVHNGAADALSRMHTPEEGESPVHDAILPVPISLRSLAIAAIDEVLQVGNAKDLVNRIKQGYQDDDTIKEILDQIRNNNLDPNSEYHLEDDVLFSNGRIMVPDDKDLQRDILSSCHDDPAAGHGGIAKTFELVSRTYYWPKMRDFVKSFVLTCDICQRNKTSHHKPFGLLQSLPIPENPWSSISMDFIVQLPDSKGYTAILVVVDRLTKMAHFIPTTDTVTASDTLDLFLSRVFAYHGLPDDIVSDRGSVFTSSFMQSAMESLGITQNLSTAYHPQTDGQTERTNAILEQYLRCFTSYQQDDWSNHLPMAELCYNNSIQSTTKQTPFFAHQGYHPRFSVNVPRVASSSPYAKDRLQELKRIQEDLQFHIKTAQENQERNYNKRAKPQPDFAIGDLVMLKRTNIKTTRPSNKLDVKNLGPFKITEIVNTRSVRLQLPSTMARLHPVFHVSLLEPYRANTLPGRVAPPPPTIEIDGNEEFEAEEIWDSKLRGNQLWYLIKFKGYQEPEWQPAANAGNSPELIASFHSRFPRKPGPPPVTRGARS